MASTVDTASRAGTVADSVAVTALLQALNAAAVGRDAAGPALAAAADDVARSGAGADGPPPLPRVLAYAGGATGRLDDAGWDALLAAADDDLAPSSSAPADVRRAALAALTASPPHLAAALLPAGGGGAGRRIVPALEGGPARARPAAARAAAALVSRPDWLSAPGGPATAFDAAAALGDALLDDDAAVTAAAAGGLADAADAAVDGHSLHGAADAAAAALNPVIAHILTAAPAVAAAGARLPPPGAAAVARCGAAALAYGARRSAGRVTDSQPDAPPPPPPSTAFAAFADAAARVAGAPDPIASVDGVVALARVAGLAAAPCAGAGAAAPAVAGPAAAAAIAAASAAWTRPGLEAARPQLAGAAAAALPALALSDRARAARRLALRSADLPRSADRAAALAAAAVAIADVDLASRAARRGGAAVPGGDLKTTLTHPALAAAVRGDEGDAILAAAPGTMQAPPPPGYRDELVLALVGAVRRAPAAAVASRAARDALARAASSPPGVREHGATGLADDWLGAARVALAGTRACVGWDLSDGGGGVATTAAVDAWLSLLADALRVARALEPPGDEDAVDGGGGGGDATANGTPGPAGGTPTAAVGTPAAASTPPAPRAPPATHRAALQRLLTTLLVHWRAVAPAARPRALWAAAAGLDLPPRASGGWALVLRAAEELLDPADSAARSHRKAAARAAAAVGVLCLDGGGGASSSANNPFASTAATADPPDAPSVRADARAVGLAVVEAAASHVASCIASSGGTKELRDLAAAVVTVASAAADGAHPPDARERAARAAAVLSAAAAGARNPEDDDEDDGDDGGDANHPRALLDGARAPCPLAAPSGGGALCVGPLGARYASLTTGVGAGLDAVRPPAARPPPPPDGCGVAGAADVAAVVSRRARRAAPPACAPIALPPVDLGGPGDPVRVVITPTLHPSTRSVALACEAVGATAPSAPRASLTLEWGGALAGRGAASVRLPALRPGESFAWRAAGTAVGFGPATITARLEVGGPPRALTPSPLNAGAPAPLRLAGGVALTPADWLPAAPPAPPDAAAAVTAARAAPLAAAADAACARGGAAGPPALLGALTAGGRLVLVWHAPLTALGGFTGLLRGCAPGSGAPLWVVVSAWVSAGGGDAAASSTSSTTPLGVARLEARTRDPGLALALAADPAAFFGGLARGEVVVDAAGRALPAAAAALHTVRGGAPPPPPPGLPGAAGAALAAALDEVVSGSLDGVGAAMWARALAARVAAE